MSDEKDKPFAQIFICRHCGEPQFIFSLDNLREMGVNVQVVDAVLEESEIDKDKLN